jgi:hypothetical protein
LGGVGESGDGSVRPGPNSTGRSTEFQTRAAELRDAAWQLHRLYPDEANKTCGMHIHVSFSTTDTGLLATTEFFEYFRERWKAWGLANNIAPRSPFWTRLTENGRAAYAGRATAWRPLRATQLLCVQRAPHGGAAATADVP